MKKLSFKFIALLPIIVTSLVGCNQNSDESTDTIPVDPTQIRVQLTGFNDYHAHISERNGDVGLPRFSTYLKKRKAEGSIIINSGDIWKGEYMDSYTRGGLMSKAMKEIGVDVNVLGNHEFDWGPEYIIRNQKPEYLDDYFLGANIMKYPKGPNGWEPADDLCKPYKIITRNAGTKDEVKVGVIGAIGAKQLELITSTSAQDYFFINVEETVKKYSTILRKDKKCDLVILSYHEGELGSNNLTVNDPLTGKPYIDGAFLGHTHQLMLGQVNGVPYIQSECFGSHVGEMSFDVNRKTREVTFVDCDNVQLKGRQIERDPKIIEMIDAVAKGENGTEKIENEVLGTCVSNYIDKNSSARMYAKWSAKKIQEISAERGYPEIAMAMFNHSREKIRQGEVKYSDLFVSNPFQNTLYIINVTGANIYSQAEQNSCWYRVSDQAIENSRTKRYNILVYSYNGLHIRTIGDQKEYNYFPTLDPNQIIKIEGNEDGLNAVDIVAQYMREKQFTELNYKDYLSSKDRYNSSKLSMDISGDN